MSDFRADSLPIEIVEWVDSNFNGRWQSKQYYDEQSKLTMRCLSIGYVWYEAEDRVCLVQSESHECAAEMITIPKVAITKRTVLLPQVQAG